jgi:glycosyltransferase involved in cell wall biosynthesis
MNSPLQVLSISHSYVLALNRRLPHEMALAGRGRWEITAVAPSYYAGRNDLRPIRFEEPRDEACRVIPVSAYFSDRIHFFTYGKRLRTLLREPWELVHCWQEPYTVAGAQVAWLTPKPVPLVFWTAQSRHKKYPPPFSTMERYCLGRCAGWLACGRTTLETQLARGVGYEDKPHRIAPLGVDTDSFRPDPALRAATLRELGWDQTGPPVVGFLGRFVPEKGLLQLTRILDGLKTPWRALLVGSGPLEPRLRAWAQRHGPQARVVTGVVHRAVPRYLNAMDVLCVPSRTTPTRREQQGRVIIEAWACGVPVLGSDCGEIPHVIADVGVVVAEGDEPGWTTELSNLLESPGRRAELGARGLARATTVYAWPVIARLYLDFFAEILETRPR